MPHAVAPNRFLSSLFAGTGQGAEVILAVGKPQADAEGKIRHRPFRQRRVQPENLLVEALKESEQGWDVWYTPGPRIPGTKGRTKATSAKPRVVWADCDEGLTEDTQRFLTEAGATIVASGGEYTDSSTGEIRPRVHVYLHLDRPADPFLVEYLNRALTGKLGADAKWSSDSLLRVPGTQNHKQVPLGGEPTSVVILQAGTQVYTPRELAVLLGVEDPTDKEAAQLVQGVSEYEISPEAVRGKLPDHISAGVFAKPGEGGKDRSSQRYMLIADAVEWGYSDAQILWLLSRHAPTLEKYGEDRHIPYSVNDIAAHRELHPHTGQNCHDAKCSEIRPFLRSKFMTPSEQAKREDMPAEVVAALDGSSTPKAKKDRCARMEKIRMEFQHEARLAKFAERKPVITVQDLFELFTLARQGHSCGVDAYEAATAILPHNPNADPVVAAHSALSIEWPEEMVQPCTGQYCGQRTDSLELLIHEILLEEFRAVVTTSGTFLVHRDGPRAGVARWELHTRNDAIHNWICQAAHARGIPITRGGATKSVREAAISLMVGTAEEERPAKLPQLQTRSAPYRDGYLVNMSDGTGTFLYVDATGWSLVAYSPDMPVFASSPTPMPKPERGASPKEFCQHLGFSEDSDEWRIAWSWAVTALMTDAARPLLALTGPSGAGKTGRTISLAAITDPLVQDREADELPENMKDFALRAASRAVVVAGNLDKLTSTTSNRICQLVTGAALSWRTLYSNDALTEVIYQRTGIINGIDIRGLKNDASERILNIDLGQDDNGREYEELGRDREQNAGRWFGALLDDLVRVLAGIKNEVATKEDRFGMVARAAKVLGQEFYEARVAAVNEERAQRADNDEVIQTLADVIFRNLENNRAEVTAGELYLSYKELAEELTAGGGFRPDWMPKSASGVAYQLRRHTRELGKLGIKVKQMKREAKRRPYEFVYDESKAEVLHRSVSANNADSGPNAIGANPTLI